jgi:putative MFS transporter
LAAAKALFLPSLRRTTTLLGVAWFGLSFGWYGLNVWLPTLFAKMDIDLDIYAGAFLVTAANLPGNVLAALLVDRMGRKNLMAGSILLASFAALGLAFATTSTSVLLLASLMNAVSNGGWNTLDALSTESFPTRLRTGALGVLAACGRMGSITGQFVFGALVDVSIPLLLGSAACMLLVGAVASFLLPKETAGAALDDDVEELRAAPVQQQAAEGAAKLAPEHTHPVCV